MLNNPKIHSCKVYYPNDALMHLIWIAARREAGLPVICYPNDGLMHLTWIAAKIEATILASPFVRYYFRRCEEC